MSASSARSSVVSSRRIQIILAIPAQGEFSFDKIEHQTEAEKEAEMEAEWAAARLRRVRAGRNWGNQISRLRDERRSASAFNFAQTGN